MPELDQETVSTLFSEVEAIVSDFFKSLEQLFRDIHPELFEEE